MGRKHRQEREDKPAERQDDSIEKIDAPGPWPAPPDPIDEHEEVTITKAAHPVRIEMELQGYAHRVNVSCGHGLAPGCRQDVEVWSSPRGQVVIVNPMPTPESPWKIHSETCPAIMRLPKVLGGSNEN
jgi:hypothetical protein